MRTTTAIAAAMLAALHGCACDTVPADALEDCSATLPVIRPAATDILFVIDDSASMGGEQTLLQNGLASFIQALSSSPIANDFQIGVTTSSVENFAGAPFPPAGAFVSPGIMAAASPTLVADFQGAVAVGTSGSTREQPFRAALLALERSAPGGLNEGFLRPGARLAIIFVSDEDDCSGPRDTGSTPIDDSADCRAEQSDPASTLTPISTMAAALLGPIQGDTRDVVVAAIVGVAPGTLELSCGQSYCSNQDCSTALDQGTRFVQLLTALGSARTRLASICDAAFDDALAGFADVILSQTITLDGAPADWRMLVARVERPGVGTIGCTIAPTDAPAAERNGADAVYEPPRGGAPATLSFQRACALEQGDRVSVDVVCAG